MRIANRLGWRLPDVAELTSNWATFGYWTASDSLGLSTHAYAVAFKNTGGVWTEVKTWSVDLGPWCVRGGPGRQVY